VYFALFAESLVKMAAPSRKKIDCREATALSLFLLPPPRMGKHPRGDITPDYSNATGRLRFPRTPTPTRLISPCIVPIVFLSHTRPRRSTRITLTSMRMIKRSRHGGGEGVALFSRLQNHGTRGAVHSEHAAADINLRAGPLSPLCFSLPVYRLFPATAAVLCPGPKDIPVLRL